MMDIAYVGKPIPLSGPLGEAAVEARNAGGEAVVGRLQDHFLALNAKPNRRNWPKRGFWADVLKAVGSNISQSAYAVTVASPAFWRRWKGGDPITAKAKRRLALPAIAEAYVAGRPAAGRVPVDLTTIVRKRTGKPPTVGLAEYTERPSKRDPNKTVKEPGRVWYWLVQQADPAADPNAVPPRAELVALAVSTADAYLNAVALRIKKQRESS
jgi:hypothetical protein